MRLTCASIALGASVAAALPQGQGRPGGPTGFPWGHETVRGVNIGGWLVLEPWITPSIFQKYPFSQGIVDEYTLCNNLGRDACYDVLKPHWDSWVTKADFVKIKKSGFNVVRVPVGYWAYDNSNSPYASGAAPYVDAAIDWARQVGLKVIVDLHGAPGSQNGFDNSGQKLERPTWQDDYSNVQKTLDILQRIQDKYGDSSYDDVIAAVELLNEPLSPELNFDELKQFFRNGFGQQRTSSQTRVVMIQDGFQPPNIYNGWLTPSDDNAQNVALDHHEYQVFNDELVALQPWEHRQLVCNNAYVYSGADKWTIVGEWAAAMTDCAAALNGYGIGARYDGTYPNSSYVGSCDNINYIETWSQTFKDDMRGYIEAQLEVFEKHTQGWVFWNFKTEGSPEWDAFRLIDAGIFPQPLTDRKFGPICT
ncbi:glycoside hydrolase family 5 protein [Polychaeton citri CBS 116435]|uniref:glucan 1,3-beta-glucosidase n=1 Tax=Polychaeton citri CBS 116435 TaxID=1314669 RepID=A0A9P4Q6K4_9PEZI|nr:glycoside hydrolase family 5 protein [Polychaeton citri CBS 116435]